jgi:membrane protease YdiL (CAAX protease family)
VAFILGAAASLAFAVLAASVVLGITGVVRQTAAMALVSGFASAGLWLVTLGLLRREGLGIAALGLPLNRPRAREFALGVVVSAALFLAVAWTQSAMVGAGWHFQGTSGVVAAVQGLALAASMVMAEELVFRGAALRYLRDMCGDRLAIGISAVLFGAYHLIGSHDWAMGAVFRFVMPMAGGLLFGWAAVKSGGLALPIGLHLGGNWIQASVAVFSPLADASAAPVVQAIWRIPIGSGDAQWLTAPDVLQRLPYVAAVALAAFATRQFLRVQASPA